MTRPLHYIGDCSIYVGKLLVFHLFYLRYYFILGGRVITRPYIIAFKLRGKLQSKSPIKTVAHKNSLSYILPHRGIYFQNKLRIFCK